MKCPKCNNKMKELHPFLHHVKCEHCEYEEEDIFERNPGQKEKQLNELTIKVQPCKKYAIDFDKVKDFNDLKQVVQILFAEFPITISEDCGFIDEIKEYLVEIE